VIDAVTRAIGVDYATVHRGVYTRSAEMTLAFEAARRKVAGLIGAMRARSSSPAARPRRSTWSRRPGAGQSQGRGPRAALDPHHSNIVPWQLLRERTGIEIDVCPLTEDGRIDLDAAERC
jgi:cysteine desulfurase/selenocysteine lyase